MTTLTATAPAAERMPEIIRLLHETYPDAHCELTFNNALELLVATILSAQCTDERVNQVTPVLFARFPTAQALAEADINELEEIIRSTGFYRNKAKSIQSAARRLVELRYGREPVEERGFVPRPDEVVVAHTKLGLQVPVAPTHGVVEYGATEIDGAVFDAQVLVHGGDDRPVLVHELRELFR